MKASSENVGDHRERVESRNCANGAGQPPPAAGRRAFTLLEVMIAVTIFFVALGAILAVLTRGLAAARGLQISGPDAGMLAAEFSVSTNQLHDGKAEHGDFGQAYPDYTWERETYLIATNGLFEVDFFIFKKTPHGPELYDALSTWMYKPESPRGPVSRPAFAPRERGGLEER